MFVLGNLLIHIQFKIVLVYFPVTEAQTCLKPRRIRSPFPLLLWMSATSFWALWLRLYKLHSVISSDHA